VIVKAITKRNTKRGVHADITLTLLKIEVKVRGHMSLAKLQVSLRTDLCHLAAAAMTVSPLPWLFFTSWMLFLPPNQQRQCSEGHICPLQRETDTTQ